MCLFASNPSSSSAAWEETHTLLDGERVQGGTHHSLQLLQVLHLSQSVCEKGRRERSCASTLHVDLDPGSTRCRGRFLLPCLYLRTNQGKLALVGELAMVLRCCHRSSTVRHPYRGTSLIKRPRSYLQGGRAAGVHPAMAGGVADT